MAPIRSAAQRHTFALCIYTLLALALTWPLAAHFATHVTGDSIDDPALAWNLWWIKARLVEQLNPDIFHAGWMFHPLGINLAFYTLTPLNGLLSLPLQSAFSVVVANNLLLLASFVLGGFGAYLLVGETLHPWQHRGHAAATALFLAALLAGGYYAFASAKLFYASLGQFNIASSHWIPFCVLYLVRMVRRRQLRDGMRDGAVAGLFLVFQLWSELTYASFLLLFAILVLAWRMLTGAPDGARTSQMSLLRRTIHLLAPFAAMGVVFAAGLLPFLWAMAPDLAAEGDFFASGGGFADIFSADLAGYLMPTRLHPLMGGLAAALPFPNDKGQHIFLGYLAVALAALGLWQAARRAATRPWAWLWGSALLAFWLLTLGPQLRWMGSALPIPGPFALVSQLPIFSGNRYPSRYSVMLLLVVAVLLAAGGIWLLQQLQTRAGSQRSRRPGAHPAAAPAPNWGGLEGGFLLLAALLLFEQLATPLPLSDFRPPPILQRLAAAPGDGAVLELPTGWRNGARVLGRSDVLIMMQQWYQTAHGRPRLGGNTSRNPAYKFQYFSEAPLLGDLIALMNADRPHIAAALEGSLAAMIDENRAIGAEVLDFLDIDHILVYVDHAPPQLLRLVEDALPVTLVEAWQGSDWLGRASTIRLYAVDKAARRAPGGTLDLGTPFGNLYLGEGWAPTPAGAGVRLATRPSPVLLLDLPEGESRLQIEWYGPVDGIGASINGQEVPVSVGQAAGGGLTVDVPAGVAGAPVDRLQLRLPAAVRAPAEDDAPVGARGWPVGDTGAFLAPGAGILVRSAGEETGNFASIVVNRQEVAPNRRGYNLAALAPDGHLLASAVFDTHGDAAAAQAMAAWLDDWPPGTIIAGAVADEASNQLGQPAIDALARVGVAGDLRGRFRWGHAFVGVAGARPGAAVETSQLLRPDTVTLGQPAGGAPVYGGVKKITIEAGDPQ